MNRQPGDRAAIALLSEKPYFSMGAYDNLLLGTLYRAVFGSPFAPGEGGEHLAGSATADALRAALARMTDRTALARFLAYADRSNSAAAGLCAREGLPFSPPRLLPRARAWKARAWGLARRGSRSSTIRRTRTSNRRSSSALRLARRDFHEAYNDAVRRCETQFLAFVDSDVFCLDPRAWPRAAEELANSRVAAVSFLSRARTASHGTFAVALRPGPYREALSTLPGGFFPAVEGVDPSVPRTKWIEHDTGDLVTRAVIAAGHEVRFSRLDGDGGAIARV